MGADVLARDSSGGLSQICKDARERHKKAVDWQQRWSWLWLVLGVVAVLLVVVAAVFFLNSDVTKGALSVGSSIVSGAIAKFVLDQRKEAKKDADDAWGDVKNECPEHVQAAADAQQAKLVKIALIDRGDKTA